MSPRSAGRKVRWPRGRDARGAVSARLLAALAAAVILPLLALASPAWWSERGVLDPVAGENDYALVNQGQLKNIAKAAVAEMDARLPGGAGETLHALVEGWAQPTEETNDYAAVNVGQLKAVARPFYDRLIAVRYSNLYPWPEGSETYNDFAAANVGQVKNLFSFDFGAIDAAHDADANSLPDWWEQFYFSATGVDPQAQAARGDGLTNLQAFQQTLNPNDFYNGAPPVLQKRGGDGQRGNIASILEQPLKVLVTDAAGNPLPNAPVTFTGSSGAAVAASDNGFFGSTLSANADASGIVVASVRLPAAAGIVQITATPVTSGSNAQSLSFTATAVNPIVQIAPPPYEVRTVPANAPPYLVTFQANSRGVVAGSGQDRLGSESDYPARRSFLWDHNSGAYSDLGSLVAGGSVEALALNNNNDVVGQATGADGEEQAFFWRNGTMQAISVPGSMFTVAYGVNDAGQVIGLWQDANWRSGAFLWQDGALTLIDVPGSNGTNVESITADGRVFGSFYDQDWNYQTYIWQNGTFTMVTIPGAISVEGRFINDAGQVAGTYRDENWKSYGFLWENGVSRPLSLGGYRTAVYDLNSVGAVVGSSMPAGGFSDRPFVWRDGQMTPLPLLGAPSGFSPSGQADSINDAGIIVGTSSMLAGGGASVIWQEGRIWKLNDCVPAYVRSRGGSGRINNSGDIVGKGYVMHRLADADGDGLPDGWETQYALRADSADDMLLDGDGDGLTNYAEYQAGTDPTQTDSDGDGIGEAWEVAHGYDPRDPADAGLDEDGDGLTTLQEHRTGTDPRGAYTVTDIAPAGSRWVLGTGMNANGAVIGTRGDMSGNQFGFLWDGGSVADVTPAASEINVSGLNGLNEAVGTYRDGSGAKRPFLWRAGTRVDLAIPPLYNDAFFGRLQINDRTEIIGNSLDANQKIRGFVWRDGSVTPVPELGAWSTVFAMNDAGQIVGAYYDADWTGHGFVSQDGSLVALAQSPQRAAINDSGVAAIEYRDAANKHRLGIVHSGVVTPLGTGPVGDLAPGQSINAAGHVLTRNTSTPGVWRDGQLARIHGIDGGWVWPQAFNDSDVVVGESTTHSGATRPFIWRNGHTTDLSYLVPSGSALVFSSAVAVNNRGQILLKAYEDGWNRAVLLTPNNDSDGNSIADDWEKYHFGQTGVDPNADPDGDSVSNREEFDARTNPNSSTDSDADGVPDDWETIHGGEVAAYPGVLAARLPRMQTTTKSVILNNASDRQASYSVTLSDSLTTTYTFLDSKSGGVPFIWEDISAPDNLLQGASNSDYEPELVAFERFRFPFYGQSYSEVHVTPNGFINFGVATDEERGKELPWRGGPSLLIAAFMADLNPLEHGDVYYKEEADRVIIQYHDVTKYRDPGSYTFQIVLFADGQIELRYLTLDGELDGLAGIQNVDGTEGMQVAFGPGYFEENLAVRIMPPGVPLFQAPSASGIVAAGASVPIDVVFQSRTMPPGRHNGTMHINHDGAGTTPLVVPLVLEVENTPATVALATGHGGTTLYHHWGMSLTAIVSDPDSKTERVEFYEGSTLIGTSYEPWRFEHSVSWWAADLGTFTFTAKVFDIHGEEAVSAPITIEVVPDTDEDNDGLKQSEEVFWGTDPANPDTDGDGLLDGVEIHHHRTDPLKSDSDDDGLSDGSEVLVHHTNPRNADSDGDRLPDGYEVNTPGLNPNNWSDGYTDADNDGLVYGSEHRAGSDPGNPDTDGDGLQDGPEVHQFGTNPAKSDSDDDGLADGDELFVHNTAPGVADTDGDLLSDGYEVNTPGFNPLDPADGTSDPDGDGLTTGREHQLGTDPGKADSDGDSLSDGVEANLLATDPTKLDSDGDGISDSDEDYDGDGLSNGAELYTYRTDPTKRDTDDDGLDDGAEVLIHNTSPTDADSDGDLLSDGYEVGKPGFDPLNPDVNGDGLYDGVAINGGVSATDLDVDGDGLSNAEELLLGSSPFSTDSDHDGVNDRLDLFPRDSSRSTLGDPAPGDNTAPTITIIEPASAVALD